MLRTPIIIIMWIKLKILYKYTYWCPVMTSQQLGSDNVMHNGDIMQEDTVH